MRITVIVIDKSKTMLPLLPRFLIPWLEEDLVMTSFEYSPKLKRMKIVVEDEEVSEIEKATMLALMHCLKLFRLQLLLEAHYLEEKLP